MSSSFDIQVASSEPDLPLIVHVPHSSVAIPEEWRRGILLSDGELAAELLAMTDHMTEALFNAAPSLGGVAFVNRTSRLVCDPERFAQDRDEPMADKGMGAVYVRTSHGLPLRAALRDRDGVEVSPDRASIMEALYWPYTTALAARVASFLGSHDRCMIVDGHSFPSTPFPYEDPERDRPEICIGFDPFHAPEQLVDALESYCRARGRSIGRNTPFGGSYVPYVHYLRDARVSSVMLEVRRDLYMDEATAEPSSSFEEVRALVHGLVGVAAAFIDCE